MNDLIENERTKFTAAAVDRISTACIAIGFIAPLTAATVGIPGYAVGWALIGFSVAWLLIGGALHLLGRAMLRRLKP
jgi:hypothetical protein